MTGMRIMRLVALLAGLAATPLCAEEKNRPCDGDLCDHPLVYIGTRADGSGTGISAARFDEKTGHVAALGLAAEVARPTWLRASPHLPILYSVSETGNDGKSEGGFYSFHADPQTGKLTVISRVGSGGGGATHFALDAKAQTFVIANYGSGQVATIPLGPGGVLGSVASVQTDVGSGPSPRQKSAHAHGILIDPSGRYVLVADLGADRVFTYRLDLASRQLAPGDPASFATAPGSGPRHLVFSPNGRFVYVNTELSSQILSFRWNAAAGKLEQIGAISTLSPDYKGQNGAGEIGFSADGEYLYASNRGEDTIVVYRADPASGALTEIQRVPSGGKSPWHFAIDYSGRWLLAANEGSDLVTVFRRDPASGKLSPTGESLASPHPSSVAFLTH